MAKTKRLTNKQCENLNTILTPGLNDTIMRTIKYAATHNYSAHETMKFIASFLYVSGTEDMISHRLASCLGELLHEDSAIVESIIDFPNSNKNSENNKSSDTNNSER